MLGWTDKDPLSFMMSCKEPLIVHDVQTCRQRLVYDSLWAEEDPFKTHDGHTKSRLLLMLGWAEKDPFTTHDGQTKTHL